MSTNFYWNPAGEYQNFAQMHIGKRSGGWSFSFQAIQFEGAPAGVRALAVSSTVNALVSVPELPAFDIKSLQDWKKLLSIPGSTIEDEYGDVMDAQEFIEMVETQLHPLKGSWGPPTHRQPLLNHFDELLKGQDRYGPVDFESNWKDEEGFSFSLGEFS